jgi:hypothetical protein
MTSFGHFTLADRPGECGGRGERCERRGRSANVLITPPVRTHAVLWRNATGAPIDLTPTGRNAMAFAINANREVVGHRDDSSVASCRSRATRWTVIENP